MRHLIHIGSCSCFLMLLGVIGCDDTVSPNAPYEPRMVVYAIMNAAADRQMVRVYTSSDPSSTSIANPETPVVDATVTISDQKSTYLFHDTTIGRRDTSRYATPIAAKISLPFKPEYGSEYTLRVESLTLGGILARARIPKRGYIYSGAISILSSPHDYKYWLPLELKVYGKGYLLRMLLQYEVEINGIWFEQIDEVPRSVWTGGGQIHILYPILELLEGETVKIRWPLETLTYAISEIIDRYQQNHIVFKRVIFQMRQYEENLFNYYQVANSFRDPQSIRVDRPDYSNIPGGLGVFGAYTIEELAYELPPDFIKNR